MYILFIILIIIASILLVLAVLAQNPKSGMAANFGAGNQTMGVRQTADFLERFTWGLSIAIFVLSLLASVTMSSHRASTSTNARHDALIEQVMSDQTSMPNQVTTAPAASSTEAAAENAEGSN